MKNAALKPLVLLGGTVVGIWALSGICVWFAFSDLQHRASFGDMFGAVNALFSGLALAGVVYAILLQREDLALQRRELELTRQELARTARAQEASGQSLAAQTRHLYLAARLNAISTRIDGLNKQIEEQKTIRTSEARTLEERMYKQRHNLYLELDDVIKQRPEDSEPTR
jgi:hypothetical protein